MPMKICLMIVILPALIAVPPVRAAGLVPPEQRINTTAVRTIEARKDTPLFMPTDVAVDSRFRVYVADGAADRIVRFSPEGEVDIIITSPGGKKLLRPTGIGIDSTDHLWVADTGNHRIVELDRDGILSQVIEPELPGDPKPGNITGVAVDDRRIFAVDKDNHRVLIQNRKSGKWSSIGTMGAGRGQFQWPFMVRIDRDGYACATDVIGARVVRINPSGKWAGEIGAFGVEVGQLYRPKGLAIDAKGRLFVSDSTTGAVQAFGMSGAVEGVLCKADGSPLRFEHPMGMCFDREGRLYVVELQANRVAVVQISAQGPASAPSTRPSR